MTRVLFVCLGNICRSPMAEGVFLKLLEQRGLGDAFEVDSCGTAAYHQGERPDPRTLETLARHGMRLDSTARALRSQDAERFDWILTMDQSNYQDTRRRLGESAPVYAVLEGASVPDPYYGGRNGFEEVYQLLVPALEGWLDRMTDAP